MTLLEPLTRDEVTPELRPLWGERKRAYPDFRNLWATMAHSPIVFRHARGQLLALKRGSPVQARHLERRLFARFAERFSPRQIEERHKELLELDLEPEVAAPDARA